MEKSKWEIKKLQNDYKISVLLLIFSSNHSKIKKMEDMGFSMEERK